MSPLHWLLDTTPFTPRWGCGDWSSEFGWLYIASNLAIWAAYTAIPCMLTFFVLRRRDTPFPRIFWLFVAFILFCGVTHLCDAIVFWTPTYHLSGVVLLCTALVSWATVAALAFILPRALELPGIARLNEQLKREVEERRLRELERDRADAARERAEERLEMVLESARVHVWSLDLDSRSFSLSNNLDPLRTIRQDDTDSFNDFLNSIEGEGKQQLQAALEGAAQLNEPIDQEIEIKNDSDIGMGSRESDVRWVHLKGRVFRDAQDRPVRVQGVAVDVTERKLADAEKSLIDRKIQETQKLESLGVLAGGIAHDFNNLLTGILGNASLGAAESPPEASAVPYLKEIESSAMRAADLCKQMLAYAGKGRFVVEAIDLSAIVRDTLHLLHVSMSKKAVLRLELSDRLPPIEADATQMRQVLMNLVINASEAIGSRSGVIGVSTGLARVDRHYLADMVYVHESVHDGDYVYMEVSDNGAGMDQATVQRIFEPFFTTKFTGRGLGLAAVLGIVRGHQGALKVYSEPSRGTTFKILFPVSETLGRKRSPLARSESTWRGTGTILVVDDEETVRVVSARMLEALGFQVVLAQDGRQSLDKLLLLKGQIRLVLMDLTMPHLDGEETLRELRKIDKTLPVILMSGFNEQEVIAPFAGRGVGAFLQKPFTIEAMIEKLRKALGE